MRITICPWRCRKLPNPTRNSLWTALAANYQIGAFSVNASLLQRYLRTCKTRERFRRISQTIACLQYAVALSTDFRLRFGYKDIFRTPTLNELYYTGIGNRHLNPEKSRMWNLGATYSHTFNRTLQLSLTADGYFGNVTDKIIAVPKMFYWQMMNAGKVRQLGWMYQQTLRRNGVMIGPWVRQVAIVWWRQRISATLQQSIIVIK